MVDGPLPIGGHREPQESGGADYRCIYNRVQQKMAYEITSTR